MKACNFASWAAMRASSASTTATGDRRCAAISAASRWAGRKLGSLLVAGNYGSMHGDLYGELSPSTVIPGLVPGIHVFVSCADVKIVDGRAKPGHDEERGRSTS